MSAPFLHDGMFFIVIYIVPPQTPCCDMNGNSLARQFANTNQAKNVAKNAAKNAAKNVAKNAVKNVVKNAVQTLTA